MMPGTRLLLAGAVAMALARGLGGGTLGQDDEVIGPLAQEDPEASLVAVATGTEECHMTTSGVTIMGEDGIER
jgi:hypothetical protein